MAGYQERPHFLLEFAPGGSKHEELVVDRPEEEIQTENASSVVNELPNKVDEFLEVNSQNIYKNSYLYFFSISTNNTLMESWILLQRQDSRKVWLHKMTILLTKKKHQIITLW